MTASPTSNGPKHTPKKQLTLSVTAALRVAGPNRDGKPHKLRQIDVMRRTGMSRTTLKPLLDMTDSSQRNPDLATLQKLAEAMGVPLAFLLMTPDDWRSLIKAIGTLADYQAAAHSLVSDALGGPAFAETVLKRCKVHPEYPPFGATYNAQENQRLDARNEWRRRTSLVMAALAQPAARGDHRKFADLTALAAALANEMTPFNPNGSTPTNDN
ncbi:helix-turn-helix domain-containing protein [Achromobacter sp.]|uniref:helix-turn-helix domain-containing protein n=1 Tax=Achromobacter sp. TaxID=134375 RepID=UPI003C722717